MGVSSIYKCSHHKQIKGSFFVAIVKLTNYSCRNCEIPDLINGVPCGDLAACLFNVFFFLFRMIKNGTFALE